MSESIPNAQQATPAECPATVHETVWVQADVANLNVLNDATSDFTTSAIAAANTFLANSPPGGKAGAPTVAAPLEEFPLYRANNPRLT